MMPHKDKQPFIQPVALIPKVASLGWVNSRCLPSHPHSLSCHLCIDACPVDALVFNEKDAEAELVATNACHGCLQCVSACPTEALVSHDIDQLFTTQVVGTSLHVGCHRVANHHVDKTLHCLRALGADSFAALSANASPQAVALHIPEDCSTCEASPTSNPEDTWQDTAQAFCSIKKTLPISHYQSARQSLSRRDLLRGCPTPPLPHIPAEDTAPKARRLQRHLNAAKRLDGLTQPNLPGITLNHAACDAHSVCARVCPTNALTEIGNTLIFNPQACLNCQHCLSACPENALESTAFTHEQSIELRHAEQSTCASCGRSFQEHKNKCNEDAMPTCPACRRENVLMQESFEALFG